MEAIPRMAEDELRKFVLDYCDGRLLTLDQVRDPSMVRLVFPVLVMGDISKMYDVNEIGTVWEHSDKALPRSINGYPMFITARVMHVDDWRRACAAINREMDRRNEMVV